MKNTFKVLGILLAALAFISCGGGGGSDSENGDIPDTKGRITIKGFDKYHPLLGTSGWSYFYVGITGMLSDGSDNLLIGAVSASEEGFDFGKIYERNDNDEFEVTLKIWEWDSKKKKIIPFEGSGFYNIWVCVNYLKEDANATGLSLDDFFDVLDSTPANREYFKQYLVFENGVCNATQTIK